MAHGVLTLKEIYSAISDTDSTKFGARNAGIILFMLSSNMNQSFVASLTIKDFIDACSDYLENNTLDELLSKDSWLISPCWKDIKNNNRMVFSSPESSFYIFLHIKQRLKDGTIELQDPLFMGERNNALKATSIRDVITNVSDDSFSFSFTPTSLKKTYLNACKNHFSDNNLKRLFTAEITDENPYYSKSSKDIRQYYEGLVSLLTSRLFDASIENDGVAEENVEIIVKNYYKTFSETHKEYNQFALFKILSFVERTAKEDFEEGIFKDDMVYLNNLFEQCEIGYLFIDSDYNQKLIDTPESTIPYRFHSSDYDKRVDEVINIFDELKILDVFKPSKETLYDELTYYATHNNINFYYLTYNQLNDIFNNVILPMCRGEYKTKF